MFSVRSRRRATISRTASLPRCSSRLRTGKYNQIRSYESDQIEAIGKIESDQINQIRSYQSDQIESTESGRVKSILSNQ